MTIPQLQGPSDRHAAAESTPPERPTGRLARWSLLLLAVPLLELLGHAMVQRGVATADEWAAAAAYVRGELRDGDLTVAAPAWADPLLREAMGDALGPRVSGRSDTAGFERLFQVSIRGHRAPEAPAGPPEASATFGAVRVDRWTLPVERVHYDFVDHVLEAEVALLAGGEPHACSVRRDRRGAGAAGLAGGPMAPPARHVCDAARPWLWVGETVQEDMALLGRRCVWQHPQGEEPVRATYRDVPLGERLVLHAGLWWEHERNLRGAPVDVAVRIDGQEIGRMTHVDGDGWKRLELAIPEALRGGQGTVEFDVTTSNPHLRSLCWAASTRGPAPGTAAGGTAAGGTPAGEGAEAAR